MSHNHFASYIRIFRRKAGYTQRELGTLFGASRNHISRIERFHLPPSRDKLLALCVVFRVHPEDLFPHAYENLKKRVQLRAVTLHMALEGDTRRVTADKLDALEAILRDREDT